MLILSLSLHVAYARPDSALDVQPQQRLSEDNQRLSKVNDNEMQNIKNKKKLHKDTDLWEQVQQQINMIKK